MCIYTHTSGCCVLWSVACLMTSRSTCRHTVLTWHAHYLTRPLCGAAMLHTGLIKPQVSVGFWLWVTNFWQLVCVSYLGGVSCTKVGVSRCKVGVTVRPQLPRIPHGIVWNKTPVLSAAFSLAVIETRTGVLHAAYWPSIHWVLHTAPQPSAQYSIQV